MSVLKLEQAHGHARSALPLSWIRFPDHCILLFPLPGGTALPGVPELPGDSSVPGVRAVPRLSGGSGSCAGRVPGERGTPGC